MQKTLYIVTRGPNRDGTSLLPVRSAAGQNASVVLIQDGVSHQSLPLSRVYVLSDDVRSRNLVSPFPSVSYQDLLRLVFEAETVAVL
jgi:sulfur transfer complex TusBCD TusB component (DsrH family)